jgi:ABC-2 type transport system permease protein
MPDNAFTEVKDRGLLTGFANMLSNENARWWKTQRWIIQLSAWLVLLDLSMLFLLYVRPPVGGGVANTPELVRYNAQVVSGLFFGLAGSFYLPFGIMIMVHDSIIKERELGTMAWILSKPLSRFSFVLSKVVANTIGVMVLMVLVPGVVMYGMLSMYSGSPINAANFFGALGILALLCMFYISLVFMLGTVTGSRYAVLGVTAFYIIVSLANQLPDVTKFTTWKIMDTASNLAAFGQLPPDYIQLAATAVWIVVLLAIAFVQVDRIEL